jgi:hypothetical protein
MDANVDYKTPCGTPPLSFMQMLASCLVVDANGNTYLNLIPTEGDCEDFDPLVDCSNADKDMETMLVDNAFGTDDCGHLGLKVIATDLGGRQE